MRAGGKYTDDNPPPPDSTQAEEAALVKSILAGNVDDFEILVRRYQGKLTSLAKRHLHREDELDDALQDIFLRVYTSLPRFRGRSNLYTWIYSIACNYLIDRLRKRRPAKISDDELFATGRQLMTEGGRDGNPAQVFEKSEEMSLIWLAMDGMDPLFKNILILRDVEDLTYEEMVEILGVGMGTVKSRLFRARAELKRRYLALLKAGGESTEKK